MPGEGKAHMRRKSKYGEIAGKLWKGALDLVFPARCPVCDRPVPFSELICPECRNELEEVEPPRCLKCGKHIGDDRQEYCSGCRKTMHQFVQGRGLFTYRSAAKSMYRFKYAGRREYARFYGRQIVEKYGKLLEKWQPDALVPVPIHYSRRRERGYNQADILAREIGKLTGIPVKHRLLLRVRKTLPQKQLSDSERQNNLKRAFKIGRNDVKLKRVIIIDDIYTTGSTIDACAAVLETAGVEQVYFISVSIGKDFY